MCSNFDRQCDRYGIHKPQGGSECRANPVSYSGMGHSGGQWSLSKLQSYRGCRQFNSGQFESPTRCAQLDVTSAGISNDRRFMGTAHGRPVCDISERSATSIQHKVLGTNVSRDRCFGTKLGIREQLHKPSVGPVAKSHKQGDYGQSGSHGNSTSLAQPTMVQQTEIINDKTSIYTAKTSKNIYPHGSKTRTLQEPDMEGCRLEDLWQAYLINKGWSVRARKQFELNLAPSTLRGYNNMLKKCYEYCKIHDFDFPPTESKHLADFLCALGDSSDRPKSMLATASAALSHVYAALDLDDLTKDNDIMRLCTALIKSSTTQTMKRSTVLPVDKFTDLFRKLGSNDILTLKLLRLKAVTLLALALMLRPSDIAPHAKHFNADTFTVEKVLFTTDMLRFTEDGVHVSFFGIKNDTKRDGFVVFLPKNDDLIVDPVSSLQDYINKTEHCRQDKSVFLALKSPYQGLSASSIAKILEESIDLAGLGGQGFTAKSFRPTGATVAIDQGLDPKIVQQIGRWKTADVFFQHYVHSRTPDEYTTKILNS